MRPARVLRPSAQPSPDGGRTARMCHPQQPVVDQLVSSLRAAGKILGDGSYLGGRDPLDRARAIIVVCQGWR